MIQAVGLIYTSQYFTICYSGDGPILKRKMGKCPENNREVLFRGRLCDATSCWKFKSVGVFSRRFSVCLCYLHVLGYFTSVLVQVTLQGPALRILARLKCTNTHLANTLSPFLSFRLILSLEFVGTWIAAIANSLRVWCILSHSKITLNILVVSMVPDTLCLKIHHSFPPSVVFTCMKALDLTFKREWKHLWKPTTTKNTEHIQSLKFRVLISPRFQSSDGCLLSRVQGQSVPAWMT